MRQFVTFEGRRFPLVLSRDVWRVRSRNAHHPADFSTGCRDIQAAKKWAAQELARLKAQPKVRPGTETLEDAARVYLDLPKRCTDDTARRNVDRLRVLVRKAWGRELAEVKLGELRPRLWLDYFALRQGGKLDLARRRASNNGPNAAVKSAASVFSPKLRPAFRERGILIPDDATVIQWLPVSVTPKPAADDEGMVLAWRGLQGADLALFLCIGLARFAGLRLAEIEAIRETWLVQRDGAVFVRLHDREDEGIWTKTGRVYEAPVLDAQFAAVLSALPPGYLVNPVTTERARWFRREPQAWVRPFVGGARLPLHRLRGLYATHRAEIERDAVLAKLAGERAAADALGHTTTKTTRDHYL